MGRWLVFEPGWLRTFLAVAQTLSFTQAAERLGLGQPTVSQHVRKLEQSVGRALFVRDTRTVALTADGEAMAQFARRILAAHEEATSYFSASGVQGRIRFGVSDDLALGPLPSILRDFRELYPRVDLELTVGRSMALQGRVESGHLDIALVNRDAGEGPGTLVRRDQLCWSAVAGIRFDPSRPLPLVIYQAPSLVRNRAVAALERIGQSYRVTCTVRGVNGLLAAARAGLGVAVFARPLIPDDLVEVPKSTSLPDLGSVDIVLLRNPRAAAERVDALTQAILHSGPLMGARLGPRLHR